MYSTRAVSALNNNHRIPSVKAREANTNKPLAKARISRRSWMVQQWKAASFGGCTCTASSLLLPIRAIADTKVVNTINSSKNSGSPAAPPVEAFDTNAWGKSEYTNSITASRDTNISPQEAYDTIVAKIPKAPATGGDEIRALDLGAGAGLSTAVLYKTLGYRKIDAVDWSSQAWEDNVQTCPSTVKFYEMDDTSFVKYHIKNNLPKYSVIVYNFAVNPAKASAVAKYLLLPQQNSLLFAPVNDKADYWYKQSYMVYNQEGDTVWKSAPDVGAWSVQFQPDVTSETCTGIWCGGFNGFSQRKY